MRTTKSIFLLVLLLSNLNIASGQWINTFFDTTYFHQEVYFLNTDTGFVVGADWSNFTGGTIVRTLDGGNSWDTLKTNFANFMVQFPSIDTGYAGGHDGQIYKTVDMGNSWSNVSFYCCDDFSNGYFFDNDTGFVILWNGDIYKTNTGNGNWSVGPSIGGYSPFPGTGSIQFVNDSTGIIAAGFNGTFAKTTDRGNTWNSNIIDSAMVINSITMYNELIGIAVSHFGLISRTYDGGTTWTTPVSITPYNIHDAAYFTDLLLYAVGGYENSWGGNNVSTEKGIIMKSIDGGLNWTYVDTSYSQVLLSIQAVNSNVGYIAGGNGKILKITNALSTSNQDLESNHHIQVFPNLFSKVINVVNIEHELNLYINVFDIYGTLINRFSILDNPEIDLSFLSSGIYIYHVDNGEKITFSGKLIKH